MEEVQSSRLGQHILFCEVSIPPILVYVNRDTMATDGNIHLDGVINSSCALLERLRLALRAEDASENETTDSVSSNALDLVETTATLLRAQVTKLSLLCINEPYTPREMIKIIRAITAECCPAMVSSIHQAKPDSYTKFLHSYVRSRSGDIFILLQTLFNLIPQSTSALKEESRRQDILNSTGKIWKGCDVLIELAKPSTGIRGAAAKEMRELKDLLVDAADELEEWQEGEAELLDDDSEGSQQGDEIVEKLQRTDLAATADSTAAHPEASDDLQAQLAANVAKHLRLVSMLYSPLTKRRIQRFPQVSAKTKSGCFPSTSQIHVLDCIMEFGKAASDLADSAAESLYERNKDAVIQKLQALRDVAEACVLTAAEAWDGTEDEFTRWSRQWQIKLSELKADPT